MWVSAVTNWRTAASQGNTLPPTFKARLRESRRTVVAPSRNRMGQISTRETKSSLERSSKFFYRVGRLQHCLYYLADRQLVSLVGDRRRNI